MPTKDLRLTTGEVSALLETLNDPKIQKLIISRGSKIVHSIDSIQKKLFNIKQGKIKRRKMSIRPYLI